MKYQVIIIGGGPAGYTAAEAAGKAGLSVLLIEKNNLGGVCLNEGCIPTKTLLYSAKTYDSARHASKYAVNVSEVSFDLPKIIARKSKVVRKLVLGVKAKLTSNNVAMVTGEAQIIDKKYSSLWRRDIQCGKSDPLYRIRDLYPSYSRCGNGELLDTSGCAGQ
ncbi:FAD-dependent oxidoreductase [Bacteroides thetaiotaomicron]|nr:FAD-dependent oxidoreductase [Bacteroides thetaiotaomicron]